MRPPFYHGRPGRTKWVRAFGEGPFWMLGQDSNLGLSAQNTACFLYTTPHGRPGPLSALNHILSQPRLGLGKGSMRYKKSEESNGGGDGGGEWIRTTAWSLAGPCLTSWLHRPEGPGRLLSRVYTCSQYYIMRLSPGKTRPEKLRLNRLVYCRYLKRGRRVWGNTCSE
jgi:hypothetical protein